MTESSVAAVATSTGSGNAAELPGTQKARAPRGYILGLASANFGVYLALLTPVMVSLAFKVQHITSTPEEATAALGLIMGVGALFALLCNPLVGRLSDRTVS
ncbi:MAG TPA: MFS transporter, partial [Microterricola sp.]